MPQPNNGCTHQKSTDLRGFLTGRCFLCYGKMSHELRDHSKFHVEQRRKNCKAAAERIADAVQPAADRFFHLPQPLKCQPQEHCSDHTGGRNVAVVHGTGKGCACRQLVKAKQQHPVKSNQKQPRQSAQRLVFAPEHPHHSGECGGSQKNLRPEQHHTQTERQGMSVHGVLVDVLPEYGIFQQRDKGIVFVVAGCVIVEPLLENLCHLVRRKVQRSRQKGLVARYWSDFTDISCT